jgi:hypothetical protein
MVRLTSWLKKGEGFMNTDYRIAYLHYFSSRYKYGNKMELQYVEPQQGKINDRGAYQAPYRMADKLSLPFALGRMLGKDTARRSLAMALHPNAPDATVMYLESRLTILPLAIRDIARNEGCREEEVGYVDLKTNETRSRVGVVAERVSAWAKENHFDAVVWPDYLADESIFNHELELVSQDPVLLRNTQSYLRDYFGHLSPVQQNLLVMTENDKEYQPIPAVLFSIKNEECPPASESKEKERVEPISKEEPIKEKSGCCLIS